MGATTVHPVSELANSSVVDGLAERAACFRTPRIKKEANNRFIPVSPFGGDEESGFGREGGPYCLEAYLQEKR